MKVLHYFPESDMLTIELRKGPATGGGEEVEEGILFSYDDQDRLVFIEIDNASQRVDLTDIKADPAHLVDDSGGPVVSYTVSELARKLGIAPRTLQKTIQAMAAAGHAVGRSQGPTYPIILSEEDAEQIKAWRVAHPKGRPAQHKEQGVR